MTIRAIFLALMFLLSLQNESNAQSLSGPQELKPGEILRGRFTQHRELQGLKAPLRSEGRFILVQGKGLLWHSEKPFEVITIISATGLTQVVGGAEIMRLSASRVPILAHLSEVLSAALSGNLTALQRDFMLSTESSGETWKFVLMPHSSSNSALNPIRSMHLSGRQFLEEVVVEKAQGDRDRLNFLDQTKTTVPLSDEEERLLSPNVKP